ncbi:MAG: hypothetical protein K0U52_04740 [Gammaproteobacteria bacterium]|nr:hypothetical protein [Gammaproteobacteria bacterium]
MNIQDTQQPQDNTPLVAIPEESEHSSFDTESITSTLTNSSFASDDPPTQPTQPTQPTPTRRGSKKNKKRSKQHKKQQREPALSPRLAFLLQTTNQIDNLDKCVFRSQKLLQYIRQFSYFDEEDEATIQEQSTKANAFIQSILTKIQQEPKLGQDAKEYIDLHRIYHRRQHALEQAEMDGLLDQGDPATCALVRKQDQLKHLLVEATKTFA